MADFPEMILRRLPPDAWSHRLFYEDTGCWSEWRQGREPTFPVANEIEVRPLYAESALAQAITALTKERDEDYAIGLKLRQELAADNARLRQALARIELGVENGESFSGTMCSEIARAALANPAPVT